MYLSASFILQNFKILLRANPELWGCAIFGPKMAHLPWTTFLLVQTIIFTSIYLLYLFTVQNLKKFLQQIQSYEDAPFLFFWKIINIILIYLLAPFIVQNFKKILPVDPALWGCAIFGSKMAHFPKWEFFQKNFHFTQTPDKTNDAICLKRPKTMFFGNFGSFLITFSCWGFFLKNLAVTHYIWAPNTMLSFRKN